MKWRQVHLWIIIGVAAGICNGAVKIISENDNS